MAEPRLPRDRPGEKNRLMTDVVNEVQECRVYQQDRWYSLIEYTLFLKHQLAYVHVRDRAAGLHVLDFGCGSGYGSAILSEGAGRVTAVDASPRAIAFCRESYARDNLEFRQIPADCTLPFEDNTFDIVTSFQVIEHMPDVGAYLRLLKRVLKPGGSLYITTPNRAYRLLPFQPIWQPAHMREYSAKTLHADLSGVFSDYDLLGVYGTDAYNAVYIDHYRQTPLRAYVKQPIKQVAQKVLPASMYARIRDGLGLGQRKPTEPLPPEVIEQYRIDDVQIGTDLVKALDFFAVCRK